MKKQTTRKPCLWDQNHCQTLDNHVSENYFDTLTEVNYATLVKKRLYAFGVTWLLYIVTNIVCIYIQSALVISNFKELSEIHRDTRTSTCQISRIETKNLTTKCPKFICNLTSLHKISILKLLWKRGEIAPEEQFLLLSTIVLPVVKFLC